MSRFAFATLLAATSFATACSSDATLTVSNQESFAITDLYVDAVGDESFSVNLLGNVPLQPGQSIKVGVTCDHYDVEIIDAAGGDCIVHNADLCFNDAAWIIDDSFCTFSSRSSGEPAITVPRITPAKL